MKDGPLSTLTDASADAAAGRLAADMATDLAASARSVRGDANFQALFEQAQVGLCIVQDRRFVLVNPAMAAMHNHSVAEMLALAEPWALIHADDMARMRRSWKALGPDAPAPPIELRCRRKDGSLFTASMSSRQLTLDGRPAQLFCLLDVSAQTEARAAAEWRAQMLEHTEQLCGSGIVELDFEQGTMTLSSGLLALLRLPAPAAALHWHRALRWLAREERSTLRAIWANAQPGEPFEFQHRIRRADGQQLSVLHRGLVQAGPGGRLRRGVAILQDITLQREAERRLHELACSDEVTGLANRTHLLERMDGWVHAARWQSRGFALMSLDVEQIARIGDTLGFGAGDALATAVAARLAALTGPSDVLAYLGAGEFAWLVAPAPDLDAASLERRACQALQALEAPVLLGSTELTPRCVVGAALFPHDADNASTLLERAQTARPHGPRPGGTGFALFTPSVNAAAVRRLKMEAALRHAIERGELSVHYQPQVSLANGQICGLEALLRWHCAELGEVPPTEFIPLAEQTGLILSIGDWVLRTACVQLQAWQSAGLTPVRVAVNLSAAQLDLPDLAHRIETLLLQTGADPRGLGVEVTESMLSSDVQRVAQTLRALRAVGIEVSLDDFGTGYSNLGYLRTLPIDVVKVDRSYVHDITAAPQDVSLTRAVITMAHSLQMRVVAEGVETDGQLSLLAANGCDMIQGWFFSPALPAAEAAALLHSQHRLPERYMPHLQWQRTLLLVDDEPNILAALKRLFRRDGYCIVTATSSLEGLRAMAEHDVDVVLSDQRMPGMTGVELLRRVKELYPHTVRMVLSGYTELQSITDAVNEGAIYKFLTKPWDDERLRAHVREAFQQKGLADENRRLAQELQQANFEAARVNERLQQLLAVQRERTGLEESRAANARNVLDHLPAPMIGVDDDGMVAFVNHEAQALWPDAAAAIGCDAREVLPASLRAVWLDEGAALQRVQRVRRVQLQGRSYRAVCRAMDATSPAQGRLLLLTPDVEPS